VALNEVGEEPAGICNIRLSGLDSLSLTPFQSIASFVKVAPFNVARFVLVGNSRREPHAAQKVLEAGVGLKEVPIPSHAEMNQRGFSLVVGLLEPTQDFILVSGVSVQPCNAHGRNVGPLGTVRQYFCPSVHGAGVATLGVAVRECVRHFTIVQNHKELGGLGQGFFFQSTKFIGALLLWAGCPVCQLGSRARR